MKTTQNTRNDAKISESAFNGGSANGVNDRVAGWKHPCVSSPLPCDSPEKSRAECGGDCLLTRLAMLSIAPSPPLERICLSIPLRLLKYIFTSELILSIINCHCQRSNRHYMACHLHIYQHYTKNRYAMVQPLTLVVLRKIMMKTAIPL
jgi:hypothetical protein